MEEKIDILDPNGHPAGNVRTRREVHEKGLWHRTVHIWVFDEANRILFQERSLEKENHPGLYDTSCAGHISAGETSRSSACRELSEELGLLRKPEELQYLFEAIQQSVLNHGTYVDNEFYDTYCTQITQDEIGYLRPQPHEVQGFLWFTRESLERALRTHPEKFVTHPADFAYLLRRKD